MRRVKQLIAVAALVLPLAFVGASTNAQPPDVCCQHTSCPGGSVQCATIGCEGCPIQITCYKQGGSC